MDDPRKSEPGRMTRDQRADVAYELMVVGLVLAIPTISLNVLHVTDVLESSRGQSVFFLVALAGWLLCLVSGVAVLSTERRKGRLLRRVIAAVAVALTCIVLGSLGVVIFVFTGEL